MLSVTKRIINKILYQIVKWGKISDPEVFELRRKNEMLEYQLDYMKHHFDIRQIKPATGWLREYQLNEIDFAFEVFNQLKCLDLHPFFDGGVLLGAVRHKGFIPYDDDIDISLMREEYDSLLNYCRKNFVWVDTNTVTGGLNKAITDNAIILNPGKYICVLTPSCLHIYKGTSIKDALNVEFFPFDYVKEGITENDFEHFIEDVKNVVNDDKKSWGDIFDFYKDVITSNKIFTKEKSSRIYAGIGNYALTHYCFIAFRKNDDVFPLKQIPFENKKIPVPNKPEIVLEKLYKNWDYFPNDVGISHALMDVDCYLRTKNDCLEYREF